MLYQENENNLKQNLDASKNLSYLNHYLIKIKLFVRALQYKILNNILNKKFFNLEKPKLHYVLFVKILRKHRWIFSIIVSMWLIRGPK